MALVRTASGTVRALTGGLDRFEVEAATMRALLAALDARFPGLATLVREQMAVAVDGEIHHDADYLSLAPDAEVVLIPRISGG